MPVHPMNMVSVSGSRGIPAPYTLTLQLCPIFHTLGLAAYFWHVFHIQPVLYVSFPSAENFRGVKAEPN